MDNFEYSIQISDRDWEEFYSTAEECGLMQVSLATEEELLLSDTEHEDAICSTTTSKPKFIRVSLCPPVGDHREPQTMPVSLSPPRHSPYKWIGSSGDVLSGSEDEEEFGSVARFLCQKETLLSKKVKTEHRTGIPCPKPKDNYLTIEKSQDRAVNESLVECMRSVSTRVKHHNERDREDIQAHSTERMNPSVISNESERGHPNERISVATNNPSRTSAQLLYSKDLLDISKKNQSIMENSPTLSECLPNGHIPGITNTTEEPQRCYLPILTTLQASPENYDQLTAKNENDCFKNTNSTLYSMDNHVSTKNLFKANVAQYDAQDGIPLFTTKAPGDSSAVQQNIPIIEHLDLSKTQSKIQEPDTKVIVSSHELGFDQYRLPRAEGTNPVCSLVPTTISGHTVFSRSLSTQHQSPSYRNTALTLPEMYDFFFDDVSESGIDQYRLPRAEGTNPVCSLVPTTISGHTVFSRSLSTQRQSPSYRNTALTLPEMYDFFFDDVSESGIVETGTNMASQEAIREAVVYTPDMYEYFFVEEDEHTIKSKDHKPEESNVNVDEPSSPTVVATWPEACEFFFADGPQHQDREGILFSIPPAPRPPSIFQSIVPERLQEFTARDSFHGRGGTFIPHLNRETSEETNEPTAALVANIGAVSAIRYLRRRRRTWQGPTLEPLEEI
ncbi:PGC-1 and ERR-induced regulator in muscle protein 1 isoform X2 [Lithobates pipiens]